MPATLQNVNLQPLPDQQVQGAGPLASLGQNPYKIDQLQYPLEGLGDVDAPHYMTFNINIPTASRYTSQQNPSSSQTIASSKVIPQESLVAVPSKAAGASVLLTTAIAVPQGSALSAGIGSVSAAAAVKGVTLTPKTQRIKTAIHLYTPETLLTEYNNGWLATSATAALGKFGKNAAVGSKHVIDDISNAGKKLFNLAANSIKDGSLPSVAALQDSLKFQSAAGAELQGNIAEELGVVGPNFTDLVLRSSNRAINPKLEMLFTGTANREFNFTWDFQPRSQKEAWQIYQIIRTFKAFAAPDYANDGTGRYMIPPALFDIGFYFMNTENLALPRISTCALTNITVDYNHSIPFATFNDGFPAHINMQLRFAEIDIITRELITKYGF